MIFRCSFPSNSLFLWIIRRWDSRTNLAFDFLSNFFDLLPQTKDGEWLNCCPKCFVFNHDLPELSSTGTASPLNNCSFVLSGERMRSTNFNIVFELLPQIKAEEWLSCCRLRCYDSNHNLPEFLYSVAISPLINCSSFYL